MENFWSEIGFSRRLGGVAHQEADRDDHVAAAAEQRVQVGLVVGLGLAFEEAAIDALCFHRVLNAPPPPPFPGRLVEARVINAAGVGHLAGG